jgi:hypothetical protein
LGYYEHYLMFGFVSVSKTLAWIGSRPVESLGVVIAMILASRAVFYRRPDPPLAVLYFLAPLLAYWWIFFTPGNIPRYMFYTCAIGGTFVGTLLWTAIGAAKDSKRGIGLRCASAALVVVVVGAAAARSWPELKSVYAEDEMRDDRELAAYVAALPPDASIATTHWPLEKLMILLADRHVTLLDASTPPPEAFSVVIAYPQTDALADHPALHRQDPDLTIGRYDIVLHAK